MMSNNLILRTIGDRLLKSTGKGKVCLVTGAASGIGRAAAIAMARQQGRIIVTDLPAFKERGMAVVEEIKQMGAGDAIWCNLDVSQEAQWQSVMDKAERHFGLVDVTINNAGVGSMEAWEEASLEAFQRLQNVNVDGVFLGTKYAIIHARKALNDLKERNEQVDSTRDIRSIINMSSILGLVGDAYTPAYNASKGAVRLLTKSAALYCAQQGLNTRCNSMHPGYIETPLLDVLDTSQKEALISKHPLVRLGQAHECGDMCVYLASDESSNVTGAEFAIDGGYTAI